MGLLLGILLLAAYPGAVHAQFVDEENEPGFDFRFVEETPVPSLDATPVESPQTAPVEQTPVAPADAPPGVPVLAEAEDDGFDFKLSQMPPLPFAGPEVTPSFSPVAEDDVDRWTTAFIPNDLSMLTETEVPVDEDRWIRVDLSEQMVIAYEGTTPKRAFVVSTGLPGTPTVTGTFRIRLKVRTQTMTGGSPALGTYYSLPNVEWVQYFYADYGFHGTYWHNNFGQPMSHGCINMTNADAKWLFDWAGPEWDGKTIWYSPTKDNPGTLVIVHE